MKLFIQFRNIQDHNSMAIVFNSSHIFLIVVALIWMNENAIKWDFNVIKKHVKQINWQNNVNLTSKTN